MLEANLTTLFNLEANAEQPAAQISLPAARHAARIRRYWHRTLAVATPLMVAAAVVAIVAGATLLTRGPAARPRTTGQVPPDSAALSQGFDPMRIYASFGWLPAGASVVGGETSRTEDAVDIQGALSFSLIVHQPGRCWLQPVSAGSTATELHCMDNSPDGRNARVTGRAPDIAGHRAYWAIGSGESFLMWTYSERGWAELEYFPSCPAFQQPASGASCMRPAELVDVAAHARIGAPAGSLLFPAVLTRVPTDWEVGTAFFAAAHGDLLAFSLQVTVGPQAMAPLGRQPANTPFLSVSPLSGRTIITFPAALTNCTARGSFPGGHPRRDVINGYQVFAGYVRAPYSPTYQACTPDADGLNVFVVQIGAHPKLSVTAVFSRLHLLGTDPANWTTRPVG
jgi:hypothetical protein